MKRTQSARTARQRALSSHLCLAVGLCSAITLLLPAAACTAANSGPGIAVKAGAQTIESPIDLQRDTRARVELELTTPLLCDGHVDLALMVGGSSLGSVSEDYVDVYNGTLIEETFSADLALFDVRLAGRLYPLGTRSKVRPYVGGGVGYFTFQSFWEDVYVETTQDPDFPDIFYVFEDTQDGTDTLAKGFFPFLLAGVAVPVNSRCELLFEFQYDFNKQNQGFDFSGPTYMFGARIRF